MIREVISQMAGHIAQGLDTTDPIANQAIRYLGRLQTQLFGPWATVARTGLRCTIRFQLSPTAPIIACGNGALGPCMTCGAPVCLEHALIAATGEAVCRGCVDRLLRSKPKHPHQPHRPPQQPSADEQAALRRKYLRRLGLNGRPTERQVLGAYKRRAAECHPDKAPEARKDKAHKRFVLLGEARDWLLAELEREAA